MEFHKARVIKLRGHPELSERWLQERIVEDPSLLGLGDVVVKDIERRQPRAGRLDLLLVDPETSTRYEVELQLGATDESHIIRTIEYWDSEKRRYPQHEHIAVLVAEDVTSRFLNVIGLFNGFIPVIAIQLQALEVDGRLTLSASRVVDVVSLGTDDEEESGGITDRAYWDARAPLSMSIADSALQVVQEVDIKASFKYNTYYVGLAHDGVPDNYITFHPRKARHLIARFRIPPSEELTAKMEEAGFNLMGVIRTGRLGIRITNEDIRDRHALLVELIKLAHNSAESEPSSGISEE
jgi:hypothetical protein